MLGLWRGTTCHPGSLEQCSAVAGAYVIQRSELRRGQAAAAWAVFMKVAAHSSALDQMKTPGVYTPLATTAWAQEQVRLPHAL